MKKKIELIEKIEGEAWLEYEYKDDYIEHLYIKFASSRYIEDILKNRPPLDALAINPRVCGICGHAHLIATVRALEDCYDSIYIPQKALDIRELTLIFELIQNHFKWFYLTIYPLVTSQNTVTKATIPSQTASEAIAILAGQYPHTSYSIVGGVVSEITPLMIRLVNQKTDRLMALFKEYIINRDLDEFLYCNKIEEMLEKEGDLPYIMQNIVDKNWQQLGRSHDRFIVFGKSGLFKSGKSIHTRYRQHIDTKYISTFTTPNSKAKSLLYREKFYETGPLARAMLNKTPLIKEAHRRFGDSIFSRILARVCEIPQLLLYAKQITKSINFSEPSYIEPPKSPAVATGIGIVEAARGSLIHKVEIKDNLISNYTIMTPTQWNLGNGTPNNPSTAQKALKGLHKSMPTELIFKSFDVCSVCTTH